MMVAMVQISVLSPNCFGENSLNINGNRMLNQVKIFKVFHRLANQLLFVIRQIQQTQNSTVKAIKAMMPEMGLFSLLSNHRNQDSSVWMWTHCGSDFYNANFQKLVSSKRCKMVRWQTSGSLTVSYNRTSSFSGCQIQTFQSFHPVMACAYGSAVQAWLTRTPWIP